MDYENAYDDGGKRRTTIIVIVAVVVLLIGAGVIAALVLRNRAAGNGATTTVDVNSGTVGEADVPPASYQLQQAPNPETAVGGTAVKSDKTPSKEDLPQPGIDRLLTDEEKKNYGFPVEWTIRQQTVKGSLGLQTEIVVVDKGKWTLPATNPSDKEKRESSPVPSDESSATPPAAEPAPSQKTQ